jgi:hypothetical protein
LSLPRKKFTAMAVVAKPNISAEAISPASSSVKFMYSTNP